MMQKSESLRWFSVDKICLVLAIINVIINLIILMGLAWIWFLAAVMARMDGRSILDSGPWNPQQIFILIILLPLAVLINFIFSILLCNGICQVRPKQVKAYFVYGVITTILVIPVSVILLIFRRQLYLNPYYYLPVNDMDYKTIICFVFAWVLHSLFLVLVHQTYRKLAEDARSSENDHLLERNNLKYSEAYQNFSAPVKY